VHVAVTALAAFIVTLQAPLPVQAPDQPLNRKPGAGVSETFTTVPDLYRPVADDGWAPIVPEPTTFKVSGNCWGCGSVKVAVTLLAVSIVTLHAPLPVQAPDQPLNWKPAAGVAVNVTTVPAL
jgi:hypothetical protein